MTNKVYSLSEQQNSVNELLNFNHNGLTEQFKTDLGNQNIKILNNTSYLRIQITPSKGSQDLIDSETKKIPGVSTFSKDVVNDNEVLIFDRMRVFLDRHVDEGKETQLVYNKVLPSSFRNAVLKITQDGNVLLEEPLSELSNKYTGTSLRDDYVYFTNPIVLIGGLPQTFELVFPDGTKGHATEKEYLEFMFQGQKATR